MCMNNIGIRKQTTAIKQKFKNENSSEFFYYIDASKGMLPKINFYFDL